MKLYTLILSILCCCSGLLAEAFHYTPGTVPHFEGSITRISTFSQIHDEKIEISVSSEERHGNYLTRHEYTWYAEPQDALTFGCQQQDHDLIQAAFKKIREIDLGRLQTILDKKLQRYRDNRRFTKIMLGFIVAGSTLFSQITYFLPKLEMITPEIRFTGTFAGCIFSLFMLQDLIKNRAYPEEIAETRKLLEDLASSKFTTSLSHETH